MRRRILKYFAVLWIVMAFLLTSCQIPEPGNNGAQPTITPTTAPTQSVTAIATNTTITSPTTTSTPSFTATTSATPSPWPIPIGHGFAPWTNLPKTYARVLNAQTK